VYGKISPDEEIEVDVTSHDFVKRNAKAQDALAWQKDFIILNDVTLAEAAKILEQKFKVQIKFESDSLKQCQYYGAFLSNESLQDILSIMSNVVHMKYTIEKKGDVIVSGKGCD
jgi:ferric-dicitrate binding protein FerR (iron transport regulator)